MSDLDSSNFDDTIFRNIADFIKIHSGILIKENKKHLLGNRLRKRIRELNINSFNEYWEYLNSKNVFHDEIYHIYNCVTTNETYFQRGASHYPILKGLLPDMVHRKSSENNRPVQIWSCGVSTGEEAYDIAMICLDFETEHPETNIQIIGTDLSNRVLEFARHGEYADRRIDKLSDIQVENYFDKIAPPESRLPHAKKVLRTKNILKEKVRFQYHNMMSDDYPANMDVIFCRNVLLYFAPDMLDTIMNKFHASLNNGGYLFLGPSETLNVSPVNFTKLKFDQATIFQKNG